MKIGSDYWAVCDTCRTRWLIDDEEYLCHLRSEDSEDPQPDEALGEWASVEERPE